ncbi:MAG: cell wall-binding protein, partial [Clostridiales bacterium]|nr:cell wall-binding protein [Clostridiales bacterium]
SGAMQTGWLNDNGVRYYLDPSNGVMMANTQITVDGVNYQVSADGSCTEIVAESATEGETSAAGNTETAAGTTGTLPGNGETGAGESSTAPTGSTSTTASVSGLPLIAAFPF